MATSAASDLLPSPGLRADSPEAQLVLLRVFIIHRLLFATTVDCFYLPLTALKQVQQSWNLLGFISHGRVG